VSPQLKSFEGPDVQRLLDEVRREVGSDAKISGAEKIRVGGVAGFFAKEHYRVVVEVPAAVIEPGVSPSPTAQRSRQPAHARPNRRTRRRGPVSGPVSAPAPAPTAVPMDEPDPTAQIPAVGEERTDIFTTLADATDDVTDIVGMHQSPGMATPVTAGPARAAVGGPATGAPATGPPATAAVASTQPGDGSDSFDAVLCRIATTLDATPTIDDTTSDYLGAARAAGHSRAVAGGGGPRDVTSGTIASEAAMFLATNGPESDGATVAALRRVGLDEAAVGYVAEGLRLGGVLEALLLDALGRLVEAPPLPRRAGSLLVVVGAGLRARELAGAVAVEVGGDPAEVPVASLDPQADTVVPGPLLVRSADEAAELAPGWRRNQTAAVVVVDAPLAGGHLSWAAHVISSLRPTAVWGLVDSTCKAEDITAWADGLGGIDALALENVDATVSPAAALGTGIPVARLDGRPASAARWTATIVDRIDPCT